MISLIGDAKIGYMVAFVRLWAIGWYIYLTLVALAPFSNRNLDGQLQPNKKQELMLVDILF
jgi:hypothetical protein